MSEPWRELLATKELSALGPEGRAGTLSVADIDAKLGPGAAPLVRAMLYLWHDHLDEAHRIAQDFENADGSLVHAIMHRREPDFWNSKYWFRRAGNHPAFLALGGRATERLSKSGQADLAKRLAPNGKWDGSAFVDAVESLGRAKTAVLQDIQHLEFEAVLEHLSRP